jgi:hypothetical protein
MKIKYIIITCNEYHDTRVKAVQNSWGKDQDLLFLSDSNQGSNIIGYDYLQKGYANIWRKYFEFLKNFNEFDSDWYFFVDDDTFINITNIQGLLKDCNPESEVCMGHIGELNIDGTDMDGNQTGFPLNSIHGYNVELPLRYPSGGSGFILSKTAMLKIVYYIKNINIQDVPKCGCSDVTVGFWLKNNNIKIFDIKGFWYNTPKNLGHDIETIKKIIHIII